MESHLAGWPLTRSALMFPANIAIIFSPACFLARIPHLCNYLPKALP